MNEKNFKLTREILEVIEKRAPQMTIGTKEPPLRDVLIRMVIEFSEKVLEKMEDYDAKI